MSSQFVAITHLVQNEALVLESGDLASLGEALLLELLAGSGPGIVVGVADVLEFDAGVFEKQARFYFVSQWIFWLSSRDVGVVERRTYRTTSPRPRVPSSR